MKQSGYQGHITTKGDDEWVVYRELGVLKEPVFAGLGAAGQERLRRKQATTWR